MTATIHKLPRPSSTANDARRHPSFVLMAAGCQSPDEALFLAACKYFYNDGAGAEMVADDLIVRLVWEWSALDPTQWDEETFLLECQKLYRIAKCRPRKKDLFARVIVQLIRDLITGVFLTEVAR